MFDKNMILSRIVAFFVIAIITQHREYSHNDLFNTLITIATGFAVSILFLLFYYIIIIESVLASTNRKGKLYSDKTDIQESNRTRLCF